MKLKRNFVRFTFAVLLGGLIGTSSSISRAAVVDSANVVIGGSSFETFVDQSTGLTWLDIDSFWTGFSYNSVNTLLSGSGFHIATLTDILTLQSSIPAIPANFSSEVGIVGGNFIGNPDPGVDRNLIWGVYDDGSSATGVSWTWKFGSDVIWHFNTNPTIASRIFSNLSGPNQDLGAWVVSDTIPLDTIPLPAALPLFGTGLGILGFISWRRKRQAQTV